MSDKEHSGYKTKQEETGEAGLSSGTHLHTAGLDRWLLPHSTQSNRAGMLGHRWADLLLLCSSHTDQQRLIGGIVELWCASVGTDLFCVLL